MLISAALIGLSVYAGLLMLLYLGQSRLLFLPDSGGRALLADPGSLGLAFNEVAVQTQDGESLHGWYLPTPEARGTLLFFHGNAGNISHRLDSLSLFAGLRLNVLIIDYRGYGQSSGQADEQGAYRDAQAAWAWLMAQGQAPDRVLIFGRSLGGAIATDLATRVAAAGLIVESSFTSVPDRAAELYPFAPVRWLARIQFDSLHKIKSLAMPLLVVHSREDELIPFAHGQRLFDAAPSPKTLLLIAGSHNEGFRQSLALYRAGLERFIRSLGWD